MNLKKIAVAASLLSTVVSAMAVEATQWNPPAGSLSRTEVRAELARAFARGELRQPGAAYSGGGFYFDASSTLTRDEVRAEAARAREHGELDGRNEAYGGVSQPRPSVAGGVFAARARQVVNADAAVK